MKKTRDHGRQTVCRFVGDNEPNSVPNDSVVSLMSLVNLWPQPGRRQTVRGIEGIVRCARRANPDMDIVMMHFACTDKLEDYENGTTPEVIQSFDKVAAHYGVPTLDITEEIYERIKR